MEALTRRRTLRGKTTVRQLKMREDGENKEKAVRAAKVRIRFTKMVEEETKAMLDDSLRS